jgi:hypothetical protein
MMKRLMLAALLALSSAGPAAAQASGAVDLELVLAVDISQSLDRDEHTLQRQGYVDVFRNKDVVAALTSGPQKRIAITYMEWAGDFAPLETIPWTIVDSEASAAALADRLAAQPIYAEQRTSISRALNEAARLIDSNAITSKRQVIYLSGDGANNAGPPVAPARDALVKRGIVINGLPLMLNKPLEFYDIERLDLYFERCVIGGEGAFLAPVRNLAQFSEVLATRLAAELAASRPSALPSPEASSVDCMAGEKAWAAPPKNGPNAPPPRILTVPAPRGGSPG